MAAYKTGRERILSLTGSLKGRVRDELLPGPSIRSNAWRATITVDWLRSDPNGQKFTIVASPKVRMIWAYNGLGASDSDTDFTPITDSVLTGSFSVTVPVEEWVEYTEGVAPTYGGSAVDGDVPGEAVVTFTERTKIGEDAVATMTLNGRTVTATTTIARADVVTGSYQIHIALEGAGGLSAQDCRVYDLEYLVIDVPTYSKTGGGVTIYSDGKDTIVTTDGSDTQTGAIVAEWRPPQGFALEGRLRMDANAYTGGGTVRVKRKYGEPYHEITPSLGAYSTDYCQQTYSFSGHCNGVPQTPESAAEHTKTLYHWLVPPSGEAANQWRLLIRGAYYDAGTIMQATTVALEGGFAFDSDGITRVLSPAKSFAGYRHLLIQTNRQGAPLLLTIGSKQWLTSTDTSGLAIIDLCAPTNLATDVDARDSRWPLPTAVDTVTSDGAMWGVVNVSSFSLATFGDWTITVPANGVYLSRDTWTSDPPGHSHINVAPAFLYWVPSGPPGHYWRPFLRGDTDGKRSLEEADWFRNDNDLLHPYVPQTIKQLIDAVNAVDDGVVRNPGWQLIINPNIDVADGQEGQYWLAPDYAFLNRNRNASWIEGSGIAYVDGEWRYALDVDVSSAYTLVAQMLVDKVAIYPMCGDVFGLRTGAHRWEYGSTAEEGRAELRAGRYMHGVAWGLVLDTESKPAPGVTVTVNGSAYGSGDSDLRGEYITGVPGVPHGDETVAMADAWPNPSTLQQWFAGLRRRICFRIPVTEYGEALECDGPRAWLHLSVGKRIRTYHLWTWQRLQESPEYPVTRWISLRTDPRRGSLLMLGRLSGREHGVWLSCDGGMTAQEVTQVTARSARLEVDSPRSMAVLLWENDNAIERRISRDGGHTWVDAGQIKVDGQPVYGRILDMATDPRRAVMVVALQQGDSVRVYASHDVGDTWQQVIA